MKKFVLFLAVFAQSWAPAAEPDAPRKLVAQPYSWRDVAIGGGGFVTGLVFHPVQRDLLYARTDVGGAYRWIALEGRWLPLNDNLSGENAELLGVVSLATDARDPGRVYLACGQYLQDWGKPAAFLWSRDQGKSWGRVALPFRLGGNADGRSNGERLQVDPHDGKIIFLGTNQDGLWRSQDQGQTWKRVGKFPAKGLTFVLFDSHSATDGKPTRVLYAGASDPKGPAIFSSSDAGTTWKPLPGQPAGFIAHHAAFDSARTLYFAYANHTGPSNVTDGAVWKFSPAENRWTDITPEKPDPATRNTFGYAGLAADARLPGTVMVTTLNRWTRGDDIFRTTDGGNTWKPLRPTSTWDSSSAPYAGKMTPHWMGDIALDPFNSDRSLFVTGYGIWATDRATAADTDAPTPWIFANAGLEETVINELVSPPHGAPLVSAIADFGGFRHNDLDISPPAGAHQPPHGSNTGIAFAEQMPLKLVRTHSGPARGALSLDGGQTWKDFPAAPPPATSNGAGTIALGADGARIVWLPKKSAPYFSIDDGATWTPSRSTFTSAHDYRSDAVIADRVNPANYYIYSSIDGSVHVSTDGAATFSSPAKLSPGGGALRSMPGEAGWVWVPTSGGLFVSRDAGAHFERLKTVEAAQQIGFGAAVPGGGPPTLFMLGRVQGVAALFRTDDLGKSWIAISDAQHKFGFIKVIVGDSRVPGRVYLGTGGRGIIRGEPKGD